MPSIWEQYGMKFYINTREARNERPHVHVCKGRGRGNDLKIWLDTCTVAITKGEFSRRDVNDALTAAEVFNERFIEEYEAVHGKAKKR